MRWGHRHLLLCRTWLCRTWLCLTWLCLTCLAACQFDPGPVAGRGGEGTGADGEGGGDPTRPDGAASADAPPLPEGLPSFGGPIMVVDTGFTDDDPSLTADQLDLFFGSDAGSGTDEDIWTAHRDRVDLPFEPPTEVSGLATSLEDTTMKVSADGLSLVFTRVQSMDNPDLYLATRDRRDAAWSSAHALAELNTDASEWSPHLLPDGKTLLFCSNRLGDEEIFAAVRSSTTTPFGPPIHVTGISTSDHECDPMMAGDELLFFTRQFADNLADSDIFVARRRSGWDFGDVTRLDELATPNQDRDPWVSPDLSTIYFSSDRGGASDVFMATR